MSWNRNETEIFAEALCRKLFGKSPDTMELCNVGMVNTVYIVRVGEEKYVIRLNREQGTYAESANLLAQGYELGIPVPELIESGYMQGFEYLVMTYIKGRDLGIVYPELLPEDKQAIAQRLVEIQQKASGFQGFHKQEPWQNTIYELLDTAEERIKSAGYFEMEKVEFVRREAQRMEKYFKEVQPSAYLDDISTKNLLIEGGKVSGIVDLDEIGYGDRLTYIALMRVALLNMGFDDSLCGDILRGMDADAGQRRAELFYSLLYCVDFMGERGMIFNGREVEVNREVIDRLNTIFEKLQSRMQAEEG